MTLHGFELALHSALCAVVLWSCFCRQARSTQHTTRSEIRGAFWLLAVASLVQGIAPWGHAIWPECPVYSVTWPDLLMLLAITTVQLVTSYFWRDGMPPAFIKK